MGVVPTQDREVEQVHAQTGAVAGEGITIEVRIVAHRRVAEVRGLSAAPRQSSVVEEKTIDGRKAEGAADVEPPDDGEPHLGVEHGDPAAGELGIVALRLATDDRRAIVEVEVRAIVAADEIRAADVL